MKLLISIVLILSASLPVFAASPFSNIDITKNSLGFTKYYSMQNQGRRLKVAVLDQGFYGYQKEIGATLPAGTKYSAGPIAAPADMKVDHGLKMAQILISLMTNDLLTNQWTPDLTLYNVFGFSNFKAAVDDVIARKVDLVLYSEVWQYGGNNDGAGFINAEVSRATKAGVIWVNAAGNFGQTTYNSGIETLGDDWVKLPNQNNSLLIRCENNDAGKCPVKVVLAWNDFKNNIDAGTNKDLDLALTDDLLNVIQTSALKQSADVKEDRPGYSKYPREILTADLKPGVYLLRVKNRSHNFSSSDSLRITVDGDIIMPSHSINESVLNPADNPSVITVGATDSNLSSMSSAMGKPDMLTASSIHLANGDEYRGSSNSAAIVAAGLAILKSQDPKMTRKDLINKVIYGSEWDNRGISLSLLGFFYTGAGCFVDANLNPVPTYLQDAIRRGAVPVQTSIGVRLMTPFDPITLGENLQRQLYNDMVVVLPEGNYAVYPRNAVIPAGAAEIFQRPVEAGLCRFTSANGKVFHLP